jgi:hypothetical protein
MINKGPIKFIENTNVLAQYFTPKCSGASWCHLQGVLFAPAESVAHCLEV